MGLTHCAYGLIPWSMTCCNGQVIWRVQVMMAVPDLNRGDMTIPGTSQIKPLMTLLIFAVEDAANVKKGDM